MKQITGSCLGGALAVLSAGLVADQARAADECGAPDGGSVTCPGSGNPYANGITYAALDDLAIVLEDGVVIATSATGARAVTVGGTRNASDVTIEGEGSSIVTTGNSASGATVASGTGDIILHLGSIATSGTNARGISAASSSGDVTVSAQAISTSGAGASAILAQSGSGTVTVVNDGDIVTEGDAAYGIYARGVAGTVVEGTGTVTTSGAGANGIDAISSAGAVSVSQGSVATGGDGSMGIRAGATLDALVTAGDVTTTGANATGISAFSLSGDASVVVTGAVRSSQSVGISIDGTTTASLTLGAGASVDGGTNAIVIDSADGATIDNAGTIGPANAASLAAITIVATGGPVTINNAGEINGNILFSDSDDVLNNTGVFNAVTNSDFNDGDDLLDNSGTFRVAPFSSTATTVKLYVLERFRNSGSVDFGNGHAGDQLIMAGAYEGVDGDLYFDVAPAASGTYDAMILGGAASGSTTIHLNRLGEGAFTLGTHLALVQAGQASDADAFTLAADDPGGAGMVALGIQYDPATMDYNLIGVPGDAAYRTLDISAGARNLWHYSADAWSARMRQSRDARAAEDRRPASGFWGEAFGGSRTRDAVQGHTVSGVTRQSDFGFRQNYAGGQAGADFRTSDSGTMTYGFTAGYLRSRLAYHGVGDRTTFEDLNLGAYLSYDPGTAFFNLLAKYDLYSAENRSISGGYSNRLTGSSYGVEAELGARLGGDGLFVEPSVALAATHTDLEDFEVAEGRLNFDNPDGLLGRAGARVGSTFAVSGSMRGTAYLRAGYVKDFIAADRVTFSDGNTAYALRHADREGFFDGAIGLNLVGDSGGLGLSLEGQYSKGGDHEGYGGRLIVHVGF